MYQGLVIKSQSITGGTPSIPPGIPTEVADLARILQIILTSMYSIAGVFCVVYIIIAGYNIITGHGDPQKLEKATNTLTWAFVGLLVVLASGLLINFIGSRFGIGTLITVLSLPVQ